MASKVRDLIKYEGIDPVKCSQGCMTYKQINVEGMVSIPECKLDVEQIVKVVGDAKIVQKELVCTPIGTSLEGQNLTGVKLFVIGELMLKVHYVALNDERSMHTAHFAIPFCEYIVIPNTGCSGLRTAIDVEDIHVKALDTRDLFYNVILLLKATIF